MAGNFPAIFFWRRRRVKLRVGGARPLQPVVLRGQICMPAFTIFVDRIFTTLFERPFTKLFDARCANAAFACLYRACNGD
jgi:hypothetical protein